MDFNQVIASTFLIWEFGPRIADCVVQ
jgi:hypothetical protein